MRKFKYLNKFLEGRVLYASVIIFSLIILDGIYQYYSSGQFIDETFRHAFMTGWIKWVLLFGFLVILITEVLLVIQVIFSDLSYQRKIGALMIIVGFGLSFMRTALINLLGFSEPWGDQVILTLSYINLLCFVGGIVLLKMGTKA